MNQTAKQILVAEDDKFLSKILVDKLSSAGYKVLLANNGEEAINLIKQHKPDLVLLDLIMPGKDGFDVLAAIKADPETSGVPIMVATNLGQDSDEAKCRDYGVVDYFVKSNTPLYEIIDKVNNFFA